MLTGKPACLDCMQRTAVGEAAASLRMVIKGRARLNMPAYAPIKRRDTTATPQL